MPHNFLLLLGGKFKVASIMTVGYIGHFLKLTTMQLASMLRE